MENLKSKTLSGLFWNLSEKLGIQVIQFIPTLFLARLLAPDQFGLIGMLTLFLSVANVFLDSGFGAALIQKKDADYMDECSIFYFNIFIGFVSTLVLFFAAPSIASFYHQPILIGLTRVLSLVILINAFDIVQTARLTRQLDFKTQLRANLFASLVSGVIGIATAFLDWGVWSLVAQSIARSLISTLTLWIICDWRPSWMFSIDSLKGMFGFGSRMLLSNLIGTFFDNLFQVFIGKVFSATALGYYTRAASMRDISVETTSNTVGRVMYPALASIQGDHLRLKQAYRKSMLQTTFIHFPLMVGLIVLARPLVNLLFSAKWASCVIFFQLMCTNGLLYPLHLLNLNVLKVKGRSDLYLRLQVLKRFLIVIGLSITYRWGIGAMLIGQIVTSAINYSLTCLYSGNLIEYPMKNQVLDVLPSFLFSCLMGVGMMLTHFVIGPVVDILLLITQTLIGVAVYLLLNWVSRSEPLFEVIEMVKGLPFLNETFSK
jgi:O-antigen/teichoic acid export membrane protein